jgi:mediator of RNA polymerase II transcription subunit 5
MPTLAEVAGRLELFKTQTLTGFDPADKTNGAPPEDINSYMDFVDLEHVQIPPIDPINSRAGLYIYLNAAVSRPCCLACDAACFPC